MNCEFKFYAKPVYKKAYAVQQHTHPCYELVYYVEGTGKTVVDDVSYTFEPGSIILTAPDQIHSEYSDMSCKVLFVGFESDVENLKSGLYHDPTGKIIELMEELGGELEKRQPYFKPMLNLLTEKLVWILMRETPDTSPQKSGFEYIQNYIRMNANKNISVQEIAADLGYSYDYLRQLFLSKIKISAKQYFTNEKLQNVKNYLATSDYSVDKISELTGFSSPSHLCMSFKKEFHCTPNEYREKAAKSQFHNNQAKFV